MTPKAAPPAVKRLPFKRLLLVLGVVATLYAAVLLLWGEHPKTSLAVLRSWTGLEAAALCVLNYLLRGIRWRLWMLHFGRSFGWLQGMRFYLAGYAFTPTPGNIGESVRGMMLANKPLSTSQSMAIFTSERLADLLCLLLLCLPALAWVLVLMQWQSSPWLWVALVFVAVVIGIPALALASGRYNDLLKRVSWLYDAMQCLSVRPLLWFVLTLAAWAAQGLAFWLLCADANIHLTLLTAIGFYSVAMVAGALSALPAGLGGMEAVLTGLLVAQGATSAVALGVTVVTRLLSLWLAVAIGVAALLYSAAIRKDMKL